MSPWFEARGAGSQAARSAGLTRPEESRGPAASSPGPQGGREALPLGRPSRQGQVGNALRTWHLAAGLRLRRDSGTVYAYIYGVQVHMMYHVCTHIEHGCPARLDDRLERQI